MKKRIMNQFFLVLAIIGLSACAGNEPAPTTQPERSYSYPEARRSDVIDDHFGTKVADPYRWLENPDSPETVAWVEAENALTKKFLEGELHEQLKARFTKLWNFPRYSVPAKKAGRYFFFKNDGLQNQDVLYVQDSLTAEPRVLIDPNKLSTDGTSALSGMEVSQDGKLIAYLVSDKGSDWQKLKIRKIDSGQDFPEVLERCKFSSVAWKHDGSGFFYNRFPDPDTVAPEDWNNYSRVYWHALGTPQKDDKLVYEQPDNKELGFSPFMTEDGNYLLLHVWHGTDPKNRVYYKKVSSAEKFIKLLDAADARYDFIGNVGATFFLNTDLDAPRGRIITIDVEKPGRENWKEIIPQQDAVISGAAIVSNHLVLACMKDAHHELTIYDLGGKKVKQIPLPEIGSVFGLSGRQDDSEMFFGFTSFLRPLTIYRHDFKTGETKLFRGPKFDFDTSGYETRQVFYESKDGTRVPMFITSKKGLKLNGDNPTLLYGYGGFDISLTPYFSVTRLVWLEKGGVFAQANLRGGGEYGEKWHQAGVLGNKQNVFDDFIAAAEWLIARRYTSTPRLAIIGGSNGGLLTAACMVQRPQLFGAVLSLVPVIDMLRYHKFSVGRYWVSDYGNADKNQEQFKFLYAYSPLHNIKKGTSYPPTLITTADTDNRVVPMHGKKFAASLQAADSGQNPILLRVETKAGHGGGKPTSKRIEEAADLYTFLFKILKIK
jgi:prolyl oligopeptidase